MTRLLLPFAACLVLAACTTPPGDGAMAVGSTPGVASSSGAAATPSGGAPATLGAADQAMSCDQIDAEVKVQNAAVDSAHTASAAANKGTTTSQTANTQQMSEMDTIRAAAADRRGAAATARAKALVSLGKQKKCYPA